MPAQGRTAVTRESMMTGVGRAGWGRLPQPLLQQRRDVHLNRMRRSGLGPLAASRPMGRPCWRFEVQAGSVRERRADLVVRPLSLVTDGSVLWAAAPVAARVASPPRRLGEFHDR